MGKTAHRPVLGLQTAAPISSGDSMADEIIEGLSAPPLGDRQRLVLEFYYRKCGEWAAVEEAAQELQSKPPFKGGNAPDYVAAALRSFGKRLKKSLSVSSMMKAVHFGKDRLGQGVADHAPMFALFQIHKAGGITYHRLTKAGRTAVAHVLGSEAGNTVVLSGNALAMLDRVATSLQVDRNEAILRMTASFGAG